MVIRRGASRFGCLITVIVLAALVKFGPRVGRVYLDYAEYRDAMRQQVGFADIKSDGQIAAELRLKADSIGLPEDAGRVQVFRNGRRIRITSTYVDVIELPFFYRELVFTPTAEGQF